MDKLEDKEVTETEAVSFEVTLSSPNPNVTWHKVNCAQIYPEVPEDELYYQMI